MFDKAVYWKNRNNKKKPLRGQGKVTNKKIHPKGQPVLSKDGKDINKLGEHVSFIKGKIQSSNRAESRRKLVSRGYTHKTDKSHKTMHDYKPEKDPKNEQYKHPEPRFDPTTTNHSRHQARQAQRSMLRLGSLTK